MTLTSPGEAATKRRLCTSQRTRTDQKKAATGIRDAVGRNASNSELDLGPTESRDRPALAWAFETDAQTAPAPCRPASSRAVNTTSREIVSRSRLPLIESQVDVIVKAANNALEG